MPRRMRFKVKNVEETPIVTILPDREQTRVLAVWDGHEILKAVLPPLTIAHPHAVLTLLEGLALWLQCRLFVVASVQQEETSCDALGLCDHLGIGLQHLHFEVTVVVRRSGRRTRRLRLNGTGDFRALRQVARQAGGL